MWMVGSSEEEIMASKPDHSPRAMKQHRVLARSLSESAWLVDMALADDAHGGIDKTGIPKAKVREARRAIRDLLRPQAARTRPGREDLRHLHGPAP